MIKSISLLQGSWVVAEQFSFTIVLCSGIAWYGTKHTIMMFGSDNYISIFPIFCVSPGALVHHVIRLPVDVKRYKCPGVDSSGLG